MANLLNVFEKQLEYKFMKPHKWHKEIKAWADGAEIEYRAVPGVGEWMPGRKHMIWEELAEYRIKPQPKEPQYLYVYQQEGKGLEIGYAPHEALNMWKTEIIGKIKLEQDDE